MAATRELNLRLLGVAPLRRQFAALDIRDADLPELGHVVDIFLDSPTKWVGTRPVLLDVLDQIDAPCPRSRTRLQALATRPRRPPVDGRISENPRKFPAFSYYIIAEMQGRARFTS